MTQIINKLRGFFEPKTQPIKGDIPTIPIDQLEQNAEEPPAQGDICLRSPQLIVGCSQSVGKQRDHNEDALFTLTTNLVGGIDFIPLGLYIVADGMGGHKQGEVASELAVRVLVSHLIPKVFMSLLAPDPSPPNESVQEIMQISVQEAHRTIVQDAPGSGTTLTALLVLDQQMTLAHVGDSRAYTVSPKGDLQTLTRDHSLVKRMIELGQLSEEEASVHPQRNVLYRALGQGEPFVPDITTSPLPESGHILLCSDGLWGVVPEDEISRLITTSPSPQAACQLLIDAANDSGGPDNISAILIRLPV